MSAIAITQAQSEAIAQRPLGNHFLTADNDGQSSGLSEGHMARNSLQLTSRSRSNRVKKWNSVSLS
ncbi:hypothetical protein PN462_21020 [Spirulina sp. CS-785/01]|uniref:hypothetical protein n=1 Tax=Spirulina sp. CS-785/01 TaxID=3021716 RepID=UPI00232DCA6F|nr:hypothetical protein [Spirulina sp. CS-785/01]MDB9315608.1 hypothetical protein [Spirulina sp. CS-785/01]